VAKRGSSSPVVSVLVVDDHRTFAEALGVVFGLEKDFRVEVAANGLEAVEAGAVGFVSKFTSLHELPDVIRRVGRGEYIIGRQEADRLARLLHHRRRQEATERQRVNRLTPRQTEILQMMADGVPDLDIAQRLNLSRYTLRTHMQNILTRLSVHTKVQALAVAIRQGKIGTRP